ncbi:Threonine synthase [Pseudomonas sp. R11-23-07]|nr:Threonine synthase [Pseudomonas sp. R11-23-07]
MWEGLAPDEHRYLHNFVAAAYGNHDAKRVALDLALDLGAPLNHAGRNSTVIWGVNRQGCRFSRPAPWMARGGGPPNHCRITGTPSLGEVPSGGARAFCLLLRFSKVRRRKGGTLSRRYRSNGYVLAQIQHPGRLSGRHRGQAPSHIWIARHQSDSYRPPGRHGSKLPRHRFRATRKLCRYLCPDEGMSATHP